MSKISNPELSDYNISELIEGFKNGISDKYNIDFSSYDLVIESRYIISVYKRLFLYIKHMECRRRWL